MCIVMIWTQTWLLLCKIIVILLSELNLFWQFNFNKCCTFEPQWKTMKNNDNKSELN